MAERLKIVCPVCGAALLITPVAGIEARNITCPTCKTVTKFTNYKITGGNTGGNNGNTGGNNGEKTEKGTELPHNNGVIGKLQVEGSNTQYTLKVGKNIVGRNAATSTADVRIETTDMTMSRSHSMIEVVRLDSGGYKHIFSNAKNKNATFVNNEKVEQGDKLVLTGGEVIKMGEKILKFIVSGEDDTEKS